MKEGKIRFNTVFISDKIPFDSKVKELKKWSEIFQKEGLTPKIQKNYTGNLSFRHKTGFMITASGLKNKENLTDDCFVYVKNYDKKSNTFYLEGKINPSSESIMHYLIYKIYNEINAVFHGHNDSILNNASKLDLPITEKEYAPGTMNLAKEVVKVIENQKLIILKNHGFVSLGETMKEAGELTLATLNRCKIENLEKFSK
jgi:ribulose-5-phosphate 4-epimerase/fuculose-1-phosphate aldolase